MERNKEYIESLGDELLNQLSPDESRELEDWSALRPDHDRFRQFVNKIEISPRILAQGEAMHGRIFDCLNQRIDRTLRLKLWMKITSVAASVILLLGMTGYYSYQQGYRHLSGQLVRMENPLGMKTTIILPDGSVAILNAGTTLSYPTAFVTENREVEVKGEAFFEVVSDAKRPFIVKAENLNVQVLGTKFNVKAYKEEERIEVTLTEGSVGVGLAQQSAVLRIHPGQQVRFDKKNHKLTAKQVNLDYYTSWREGKYYFNSMPFYEIARQLERIFNVHIHVASKNLENIIITGDFVHGENLEQILRVMTADQRMKYRIDGDQIYIN